MNASLTLKSTFRLLSMLSLATPAVAATTYQVTPVYDFGSATAINASGVMTGVVAQVPVVYDENNQPVYLPAAPSFFDGTAYDINAAGQIIYDDLGATFLWQNGVNTPLPIAPYSINDAGQISGSDGAGALILHNGEITRLAGSGFSVGYAINNLGHVAGTSAGSAALWLDGNRIDLGRLPGASDGYAYGINENDQVVGVSGGRAFIWQAGVMQELPTVEGSVYTVASRINTHGEIVGYAYVPTANGNRAKFLYWKNGVVSDLSLVARTRFGCVGADINDAGQIAASCDGAFRLTPTTPGADVGVSMFATNKSTVRGAYDIEETINYVIETANTGSFPVTNVSVSDVIPAGMTFISATPSQGSCSFSGGTLSCNLGNLAVGAQANIQLGLKANATGRYTHTANVTVQENDVNSVNNAGTSTVRIDSVTGDIGVSMSGATSVKRNATFTYKINVANYGSYDSAGVTLTDKLPSGMRFVSATTSHGSCTGTTTVTCNLGPMFAGLTATVSITVQAVNRGTFTNTANVTSLLTDPNSANNSASVRTTVK